jgi:dephospho-CoA kinase
MMLFFIRSLWRFLELCANGCLGYNAFVIIGITGSFGAGKGEVVEYLVKQKGFKHYSARSFIFAEAERRGLDISKGREVTIPLANELRAEHGPAYIVESLYAEAVKDGGNSVIESLRAVAEVRRLKELGALVLGVDAESHLRYERSVKRGSETDQVSYEQWINQELRESNPDDPTKQDIFGALKESDAILTNNGTLDELYVQIERVISEQSPR